MDFIDERVIRVEGGRGGNGCVSFHREKFMPKGGPDGGDGGEGGDVILRVNPSLSTLYDIGHRRVFRAESGRHGSGNNRTGKSGASLTIDVPPGTLVTDAKTGDPLGDLTEDGQTLVVARGGRGGKGNAHFATPSRQTPEIATQGEPGESRWIRLELKLLADVGLVGLPNAGKSTLLSRISAAKPKIADYPFTTKVPNLGIVRLADYRSVVVADIPGLIEGAHLGKGLGYQFLRHIERTRFLVFLIEAIDPDPRGVYDTLIHELEAYDPSLVDKPRLITWTKVDLLPPTEVRRLPAILEGNPCIPLSSVTGEGIDRLLASLRAHFFPT